MSRAHPGLAGKDKMKTKKKAHIGDVAVCSGEPPDSNPYKGSLIGKERRDALAKFKQGTAEGYTLWYAPSNGGARRITSDDVDWESSGVP